MGETGVHKRRQVWSKPWHRKDTPKHTTRIPGGTTKIFIKPYLNIDLQEAFSVTGDMLLICAPLSYSVTYHVVCAQSYRKPTGDIMTKESGNKFHIGYLFRY